MTLGSTDFRRKAGFSSKRWSNSSDWKFKTEEMAGGSLRIKMRAFMCFSYISCFEGIILIRYLGYTVARHWAGKAELTCENPGEGPPAGKPGKIKSSLWLLGIIIVLS